MLSLLLYSEFNRSGIGKISYMFRINKAYQNFMRVASYIRHGHGISRRAIIAKKNNEHPMSYWAKELNIDNEVLKNLLIYVGIHHTGLYAKRTKFYRMPDLSNEAEAKVFFKVLHNANPSRKKFVDYLLNYLGESNRKGKLVSVRAVLNSIE
jgi:hypothetical protein